MITSYTKIHQLYEARKNNPILNTSYPLSPCDWAKYSCAGELPFDSSKPIAFYIHIPFCKQICSFCEYTKMCVPTKDLQQNYFTAVINEIGQFCQQNPDTMLYGLDIGGGTPTSTDVDIFSEFIRWLGEFISTKNRTSYFEPSIEGSFNTLIDDWGYQKVDSIVKSGIKRLSLGVQSTSSDVLNPLHRNVISLKDMQQAMDRWHKQGISKINLDLMYGLPGQSIEHIKRDIETIGELNPDQVTLYEFRTNQVRGEYLINMDTCFLQYCELYEGLTKLGYLSEFGRNTFSHDENDCGLSSYLRHRMFDGWQYKGLGISAQSMSKYGISYNIGKNEYINHLLRDKWLHKNGYSYAPAQFYRLPRHELFNKFIAISGYSGGFSINAARGIYGPEFETTYHQVIDYLLVERLVEIRGDRFQFTKEGFRHYGAILSLFHSPLNTKNLREAQ